MDWSFLLLFESGFLRDEEHVFDGFINSRSCDLGRAGGQAGSFLLSFILSSAMRRVYIPHPFPSLSLACFHGESVAAALGSGWLDRQLYAYSSAFEVTLSVVKRISVRFYFLAFPDLGILADGECDQKITTARRRRSLGDGLK